MKDLKGTKTEANLMAAFAGESQARNKYTYYASKAKKDGYEQIAELFTETANNEKEHAKIWFKLLHGGTIADTTEKMQPRARITNGPTCISILPRMQKPRALTTSRCCSRRLRRLRRSTKSATESCSRISKRVSFSPETAIWFGFAGTAAISTSARTRRRYARYARTRRLILSFARRITEPRTKIHTENTHAKRERRGVPFFILCWRRAFSPPVFMPFSFSASCATGHAPGGYSGPASSSGHSKQ